MDFSVLSQIWSQQFDELATFAENIKVFFQGVPEFFFNLVPRESRQHRRLLRGSSPRGRVVPTAGN